VQQSIACSVGSRALEALFVLVFKRRVYFAEFVLRIPHRFGLEPHQSPGAGSCMGRRPVAVLSYSVYLTHSLALELTGHIFDGFHSLPAVLAAMALILLFASLLHFGVERPSLTLRGRLLTNLMLAVTRSFQMRVLYSSH